MIRLTFNEGEWQHEILTEYGEVLAAVFDLTEAEELHSFYQRQEAENEKDLFEKDASIYWSWRNQDELGGE